jgi:hypothetical protein
MRFALDFMFQLTSEEASLLVSQFVIPRKISVRRQGVRPRIAFPPGVAHAKGLEKETAKADFGRVA